MRHANLPAALLTPLLLLAACTEPPPVPVRASGVPVEYEEVGYGTIRPSLILLGTVRPFQTMPLTAAIGGTVSYPARFASGLRTGEIVAAGEELAFFENESIRHAVAEARLLADRAAKELARKHRSYDAALIAESELAQAQVTARLEQERLESAERDAERLVLRAPAGGTLVVMGAVPAGTEVAAGTVLAELAAEGPATVEASAAAADRGDLRAGLTVRLAAPGAAPTAAGRIREVATVVDAAGTVRIVADVTDATALPAPGEGVEMFVELAARHDVLSVPEAALVIASGGHAVFVIGRSLEGRRARRAPVVVGRRGDGRVEIREGLRRGDEVIVSGVALLSDGSVVEPVLREPAAPTAEAASN